MKEIKLTQGKVALIDDEDFERVNQFKWHTSKHRNTFYAIRASYDSNKIPHTIRLHRFILNVTSSNVEIDHIDRNGLNCQKSNLRISQNYGNAKNKGKQKTKKCTSKYKGVYYSVKTKYTAKIMSNKKSIHLGTFNSEIEAAIAYNDAATKLHGEYACLNEID